MARIIYGPLVTAVKGSISGITFQANPSGSIIRSRPRTTKVSTTKQTQSHSKLSRLLFEWQAITQTQRDLWNEYAAAWTKTNKFGQTKILTGLNWFTSVNWWRLYLDTSILANPPAHDLPDAPPSFALILSDTDIYLNFLDSFDYSINALAVWMSIPTKKNTLSINQIRKLVTVFQATPLDPINITSQWETATGLVWAPANNFPNANIYVCLESIRKSSGITSSLLCTKNSTPTEETETMYFYL